MSVEKWSRKQRAAYQRTIAARAALGKKAFKLMKEYYKQVDRLIELERKSYKRKLKGKR